MKKLYALGAGLALCAVPLRAQAFSDYELFALPPLEGGGGQRFFTGSSSDGYNCGVCHRGGVAPNVQIRGLPEREYLAGATYDIELVWSAPDQPHALNLEFVTPQGRAAGTITLPEPTSLQPADLCDAANGGGPAAQLIEESAPRQVLWLDDCGATRLRFRYTAPADPQLTFAASIVRTDKSEKPEGDGVLELRRNLHVPGYTAQQPSASCSVGAARAPSHSLLGLLTLLLGLVSLRRRVR